MGTIFYKASEDSEFFKKGDSISLTIAGEPGEISDGYHTFNELYKHRCLLFTANEYSGFDPNCSTCVRELEEDRANQEAVKRWLKGEIA